MTDISIKRLTEIAQSLDELSDELPELSALAEEMGSLLDVVEGHITSLQQQTMRSPQDNMPRWLREINSIVQREVENSLGYGGFRNKREYEYYLRDMVRSGISPDEARRQLVRISGV